MANEAKTPTAAEALSKLKAGNKAYVAAETGGAVIDDAPIRKKLAKSQHPFAVIVSCSDSRVPPERLFGVGVGDIFVIRVAGNTVDTTALGSIQYAVAVLGTPLVVVLGHERCGAVDAACAVVTENKTFAGMIGQMVEPIVPAVLAAQKHGGDLLDQAVRENAKRVARGLLCDPVLKSKLTEEGAILAARYDLDTGKVDFFDADALVA